MKRRPLYLLATVALLGMTVGCLYPDYDHGRGRGHEERREQRRDDRRDDRHEDRHDDRHAPMPGLAQ